MRKCIAMLFVVSACVAVTVMAQNNPTAMPEEGWILQAFFDTEVGIPEDPNSDQTKLLNWARSKAIAQNVKLDEYNIRDTKLREGEKFSPKEVFERIPRAGLWKAIIVEDKDVLVRRIKTKGKELVSASRPIPLGEPLEPGDALDGLLKPIKRDQEAAKRLSRSEFGDPADCGSRAKYDRQHGSRGFQPMGAPSVLRYTLTRFQVPFTQFKEFRDASQADSSDHYWLCGVRPCCVGHRCPARHQAGEGGGCRKEAVIRRAGDCVIITRNKNLPTVLGIADGSRQSGVEVIFMDPDDPKISGVLGSEPTWKQTPAEELNRFFGAGGSIVYRIERLADGRVKILDEIQFDPPPRNR